jgi:putative ABC transport system permease protein
VCGLAAGVAGSVAAGRLLGSFLFGVTAQDPLTIAAVCGLLAAVSMAAIYVPARRATRVDPVTALRYQ